jgi:hypothetical protein
MELSLSLAIQMLMASLPLTDLTEETVKTWVVNALGGQEKVDEIEAALQAKIEEDKNPTSSVGMPWVIDHS